MKPISFKRHRFPPETIRHAIWLCARLTLGFWDVDEMLAERGLDIDAVIYGCPRDCNPIRPHGPKTSSLLCASQPPSAISYESGA